MLLLLGFAAAVLLRSVIGGAGVSRSVPAGLVFAVALLGLSAVAAPAVRWRSALRPRRGWPARVGVGVLGALVLCVPALVHWASGAAPDRPQGAFVGWAAVVTVVAGAEEVFLRGALYRALERFGVTAAVVVPALAFAALHQPLYGWGAVPLDFAVGVWLGALRRVTGTVAAPAVTHVLADWAAWWLV